LNGAMKTTKFATVSKIPSARATDNMPSRIPKKRSPALDQRHRDLDGEIRRKRQDTLVGTLRETYGRDFARGYRSDTKLSALLERTGSASLSEYLLASTSKRFEPALKNLAKK
jgi:hypothetical protein